MIQKTFVNDNNTAYTKKTYYMVLEPKDLPYNSQFIPLGTCVLNYTSRASGTITTSDNVKVKCKELQLFGQCFGDFKLSAQEPTTFLGVHLRPSAVFKIFGQSLEDVKEQSLLLASFKPEVYKELKSIFDGFTGDLKKFDAKLNEYFSQIDRIPFRQNIDWIDESIQIIEREKGILQVKDLVKQLPFSQKSLELKFKEVVGVTPGQFIRKTRFLNFLNDYHTSGHTAKELIYHYQFYDRSHFSKEVKYFTGESPSQYFSSQFSELKKCINF